MTTRTAAAHTPGVIPYLHVEGVQNDTYPDIYTYMIKGPYGEGGTDCVYGETDNDLQSATLFAAAPQLLEALEAWVSTHENALMFEDDWRQDLLVQARAAIRLARGED